MILAGAEFQRRDGRRVNLARFRAARVRPAYAQISATREVIMRTISLLPLSCVEPIVDQFRYFVVGFAIGMAVGRNIILGPL